MDDWQRWDGQQLGNLFALDCETELVSGPGVPRLAMVAVADDRYSYVVHPDQVEQLITDSLSAGGSMVCHNVAFDFWVLDRHLAGSDTARSWLWSAVDQNRVHDSMLLAGLVGIAQHDRDQLPSLAAAAQQYLGIELEKDQYRLRYSETIGADWSRLDSGFFAYAATDAAVTLRLYRVLAKIAGDTIRRAGLATGYGLLSEAIQVKAAIGLERLHRLGLSVDLDRVAELRTDLDGQIQQLIEQLHQQEPELFHRTKTGEYRVGRNRLPSVSQKRLVGRLSEIATEHGLEIPTTPTGRISTSTGECWNDHRSCHPFVDSYCAYKETTKLRTFLDGLDQPTIHPRYRVFVRTGRTSCSGPNIQQLPRGSRIREAIVPRPGYVFLIIDYSAIELRTLAAICQQRYGFSRLGDVLRSGVDPHAYTAAMFAGVELEQFRQLPNHKQLRQQAKAINFGFPGGLGAESLVSYAKHSYGIELSVEQAGQFRSLLINQVYPELSLYLSEDTAGVLAASLRAEPVRVRAAFEDRRLLWALRQLLAGNESTPETTTAGRIWQLLAGLNNNPELAGSIQARDVSESSPLRQLLTSTVNTSTGRLRGGVSFTAARNTPFSGLAADGAKLALWELTRAGYRVVGFIHDEYVLEIPKQADYRPAADQVERICVDAMSALVGDIPIGCEYAVAGRWYKQAEPTFDSSGRLVEWLPPDRYTESGGTRVAPEHQ